MKIYLENKKTFVWQWDTHRRIVLEGYPVGATVHYANCKTQEAPVVASKMDGDKLVADIPPELMQEPHDITVYVCDEHGTRHCHFISVISRQKPESYVYEPVEILRYETLAKRIEALEQSGGGGGGGTPGQNGITPHIGENGNWFIGEEDTGKPSRGDTGPQGPKGAPGKDYVLTDDDVQEIAEIAAEMVDVPGAGGGGTWTMLTDITLTEDSAIAEIKYEASLYRAMHARLVLPVVAEQITLPGNFNLLDSYALYYATLGKTDREWIVDVRLEVLTNDIVLHKCSRGSYGLNVWDNWLMQNTPSSKSEWFRCGGSAVFPAGTKLKVWGMT